MRILFYDPICPKPYDTTTLRTEPMGGTEATVIRVAEGFARDGHTVRVCQHNATLEVAEPGSNLTFGPIEAQHQFNPDVIVLLRDMRYLKELRHIYGNSPKMYVWLHDILVPEQAQWGPHLDEYNASVITVSRWHQQQAFQAFQSVGFRPWSLKYVYNPLEPSLQRSTQYDKNKLVYFSSPHKGLKQTFEVFSVVKEKNLDFRRNVANPGYLPSVDLSGHDGVCDLGPLNHRAVVSHVSDALCVLHINLVFPETFGLVHAEANAVGTPFLSSGLGATPEIQDHPQEVMDVRVGDAVVERVMSWYNGARPKVYANPSFQLKRVLEEWYHLFKGTR